MAASKAQAAKAKAKKSEEAAVEEVSPATPEPEAPVAWQYDNDPKVPVVEISEPEHYDPADGEPVRNEFVNVVSGPHAGRYGVYIADAIGVLGEKPKEIVVRTRDDDSMDIQVAYSDCVASEAGHR